MNWWLRIRLVPWTMSVLIACTALAASLPGTSMPMPSLVGGLLIPIPLSLLAPLLPALLALYGIDRNAGAGERAALRPVLRWDGMFLSLCAVMALVVGALGQSAGWWSLGLGFGRNVAGIIGLGLLARWAAGPLAATLLPVGFVVVSTFLGVDSAAHARVWAWPIADPSSTSAMVIALLLLLLGLVNMGRRTGKRAVG
jgi:hypothetical protein